MIFCYAPQRRAILDCLTRHFHVGDRTVRGIISGAELHGLENLDFVHLAGKSLPADLVEMLKVRGVIFWTIDDTFSRGQ